MNAEIPGSVPSVLCVGVATLDIVNRVDRYPAEDSEVRATGQSRRTGGNAANTAMTLALLGNRVAWVGNLAQPAPTAEQDFARHGVDIALANRVVDAAMPTSCVLLSAATGSRSIVHFRNMPEYLAEDFRRLDLGAVDWIHFEGRAVDQLGQMLLHVRAGANARISLEVEKPRDGIETLFQYADLLLFSRGYAEARGYGDAAAFLADLDAAVPATCTWGAEGAWAREADGKVLHAPAPDTAPVVDTLGAGDVFNAGMIHVLGKGSSLATALNEAVSLASSKCTREGLAWT
jgi:ketohexokinase